MMKTTKIIVLIGLVLGAIQWGQAQVKIGDSPLEIEDNHMLEIENNNRWFLVDSLMTLGISNDHGFDPGTFEIPGDAMMLKLYGYGLHNFNGPQSYFLGTNTDGEVVEFELSLDLHAEGDSVSISLFDENNLFGTIDLKPIDTVFATDNELTMLADSLGGIIDGNRSNDLDTIQINEIIDEITIEESPFVIHRGNPVNTLLTFYEDRFTGDDALRYRSFIDLGLYFPTYQITIDTANHFISDTADVLRDQIFYLSDGTMADDRDVNGDDHSIRFTNTDSLLFESNSTTISTTQGNTIIDNTSGGGTTEISSDDQISIVSDNAGVSAQGDTLNFNFSNLGTIETTYFGVLGLDANGNVINIDATAIAGSTTDSVIYNHNGTLRSQRYMTMDGNNLHFVAGTAVGDTTIIHDDGSISIGRSTVRQNDENDIKLDIEGSLFAHQVHSSSDRRFKKNITTIDNAIDKVMQINGVTWNWRQDEFPNRSFSDKEQVGFIAQNMETVLPQVVTTASDGYKAVDYAKVTALLTEAIKEQQVQIEQQKALITAQTSALKDLTAEYADILEQIKALQKDKKGVSNQFLSEE